MSKNLMFVICISLIFIILATSNIHIAAAAETDLISEETTFADLNEEEADGNEESANERDKVYTIVCILSMGVIIVLMLISKRIKLFKYKKYGN